MAIVANAQVAPKDLSAATIERLERVPEFAYIRDLARQYGIKVYLFGGTAAAFGHYVRWDLEREAGDDKYQPERFDYDFTNIYRGNQDLDIVVDTDAETAKRFQADLQNEYPHFQGDKEAWEVRLLREKTGEKSPLLNDYDFLNQHTDSNSTGLIDVSQLDPTQQAYFDLRDWQNPNSQFLNDVSSGTISMYHSGTHETTSRYRQGMNPPILAAVRYLAKLTQYDVIGKPQDLQRVTAIVAETNFKTLSSYAQEKVKQFSTKALLNAPDVEYAWNLLDDVGLRQKLIDWDKHQIDDIGSLAWWMNKEPLRSFDIGQGDGETARELGVDVVTHETKDFQSYENITRSLRGRANVFISRRRVSGEGAYYGDGFYVKTGTAGARSVGYTLDSKFDLNNETGYSVRFHLHPEARENSDFSSFHGGGLKILNKNAIQLVPERISLTLPQYLRLILGDVIGLNDKGLIERLNRRLARETPTPEEIKESVAILRDLSFNDKSMMALRVWLKYSVALEYPEIVDSFLKKLGYSNDNPDVTRISELANQYQPWDDQDVESKRLLFRLLSQPYFTKYPQIIEQILVRGDKNAQSAVVKYVLSEPYWADRDDLIQNLIEKGGPQLRFDIAFYVLSKPYWRNRADLVEKLISRGGEWTISWPIGWAIAFRIFSQPFWRQYPRFLDQLLAQDDEVVDGAIAQFVLTQEAWADRPEYAHWCQILLDRIISRPEGGRRGDDYLLSHFSTGVLSTPFAMEHHPEWVVSIATHLFSLKKEEYGDRIGFHSGSNGVLAFRNILKKTSLWAHNPILLSYLGGKTVTIVHLIKRNKEIPFIKWLQQNKSRIIAPISTESCAEILAGA